MNVSNATFTGAYRAMDNYAQSLQDYFAAEKLARSKYTGIYLDTTLADAEKPLQAAAQRMSVTVGNALDQIISEVTDTGVVPESAFNVVPAIGKPLSATVCDSIARTYMGNMTALRFLLDVAADENKAILKSYLINVDELQAAKRKILHIVDKPSQLSIHMHDVRQALRKAAAALGLDIADPESEAYTEARFAAMMNHGSTSRYF